MDRLKLSTWHAHHRGGLLLRNPRLLYRNIINSNDYGSNRKKKKKPPTTLCSDTYVDIGCHIITTPNAIYPGDPPPPMMNICISMRNGPRDDTKSMRVRKTTAEERHLVFERYWRLTNT